MGRRGRYWKPPHTGGPVDRKLAKLKRWGLKPIIYRLFEFNKCDNAVELLNKAEIYWIAEGRRRGWPLMNGNEGGGSNFGWVMSESTRKKLSIANKGKKRTKEQNERNRLAHLGVKHSEETLLKMSRTRTGRLFSKEHKAALKNSWPKHHTQETWQKISDSKRGKPRDDETKKRLSAALKGKPWSDKRRKAQKTRK